MLSRLRCSLCSSAPFFVYEFLTSPSCEEALIRRLDSVRNSDLAFVYIRTRSQRAASRAILSAPEKPLKIPHTTRAACRVS
jgi:hypothetical protein